MKRSRWMKRRTWRIPGPGGNGRVNTLPASTVPQCRPPPHPPDTQGAAVLQSVRGERGGGEEEEEEGRGGTALSLRVQVEGGRRRDALLQQPTVPQHFLRGREREREGERERREVKKSTESSRPDFSFLHPTFLKSCFSEKCQHPGAGGAAAGTQHPRTSSSCTDYNPEVLPSPSSSSSSPVSPLLHTTLSSSASSPWTPRSAARARVAVLLNASLQRTRSTAPKVPLHHWSVWDFYWDQCPETQVSFIPVICLFFSFFSCGTSEPPSLVLLLFLLLLLLLHCPWVSSNSCREDVSINASFLLRSVSLCNITYI